MDHALAWALSSHLGDIIGYLASALVLATFSMRSMRPLRMMAIASNIAFIAYAVIGSMPPILILHSLNDSVVTVEQSRAMSAKLKRAGKNVRYVELKGDDHWLSSAPTRTQMLQEVETFLTEHLGKKSP